MKLNKFFYTISFPVAWLILVHFLLLFPDREYSERKLIFIPHLDKIVHFGLYMILVGSWVIYYSLKEEILPQKKKLAGWLIVLLAAADGILIEYLQKTKWIQRDFDWFDVLFDMIGAIAGFAVATWLTDRLRQKEKPL